MLPVTINRKAYGESIDSITFDLSDLESQFQGQSDIEGLYVINEPR